MKIGEQKISQLDLPILGWQALKWNYFGNAARTLSQFLVGVLLARLLGPEPFGVVAIAWIILGIGNLIADLGFGAALVQRESFSKQDLRFIFTCQIGLASFLTLLGVVAAPHIALFFHRPDAAPVIQAMSALFVIQALGQTATAVLRRALDFKKLQQITILTYLIGYLLIGVPAAYMGLGVWSLVLAQLLQSLLNSILLIRITGVPITPSFNRAAPGIVSFGLKIIAANISSWCISSLDTVFIGRAFGVIELGLYNRAMNLVNAPMNIITTGFQGVLFSTCARSQDNPQQIQRIYLATNAAVAMICFPLFITAAIIPDTLVLAIYGAKWQAAALLITPLSLAVMTNALLAITGPILTAANKVEVELKNQLLTILVFIPTFLILVQYSLLAVAWGVFAIYGMRWLLLTIATLRITGATVTEFAGTFRVPVMLALSIGLLVGLADEQFSFLPPFYRLLVVASVALATLLIFTRFFGAYFLKGNISSLVKINNLSPALRRFINV